MYALRPGMASWVLPCPKLEELVLVPCLNTGEFGISSVIEMAASRASRGAKLSTVRIVIGKEKLDPTDMLELGKYVSHVEYGPDDAFTDNDSDDSDNSDSEEDSDDSDEGISDGDEED